MEYTPSAPTAWKGSTPLMGNTWWPGTSRQWFATEGWGVTSVADMPSSRTVPRITRTTTCSCPTALRLLLPHSSEALTNPTFGSSTKKCAAGPRSSGESRTEMPAKRPRAVSLKPRGVRIASDQRSRGLPAGPPSCACASRHAHGHEGRRVSPATNERGTGTTRSAPQKSLALHPIEFGGGGRAVN